MQIDRQSLDKLLSLNDRQLSLVINKIAASSGLDLSSFNIDPKDIKNVRQALTSATDEDLRRITEQYEASRKNGGGRRG